MVLILLALTTKTTVCDMDVSSGGVKIGTLRSTEVRRPDGSGSSNVDLTMTLNGRALHYIEGTAYVGGGRPVKNDQVVMMGGKGQQVTKTYGTKDVLVEKRTGGRVVSSRRYPIPRGVVTADPSNEWFWNGVPKKGQTVTYGRIEDDGTWQKWWSTYVGDASLALGGKKVKAHFVTGTDSKSWLDDEAEPFQMEGDIAGHKVTMLRKHISTHLSN